MSLFEKKKSAPESTVFSDFIRNAPSSEKKRVYTEVLKKATDRQLDVMRKARDSKSSSSS